MRITIDLPPTNNTAYKISNRGGRSFMYMTSEGRAWKEMVGWKLKRFKPKSGDFEVVIDIYYKYNRDIDAVKLILDSLEGHIYKNDRQVVSMLCYKSKDLKNPRLELSAYKIG